MAAAIGASLAENTVAGGVQAYILDSSMNATGALAVTATATQIIDATVVAGSVAISGGAVGVGLSGAGASSSGVLTSERPSVADVQGQAALDIDRRTRGACA